MTPFYHAEFGGAFLAPELTDESGRKKMMGSVMFFEAESMEEVRKVVEADPYFTGDVVRACNSQVILHPTLTPLA
jgi:hypothetical protein